MADDNGKNTCKTLPVPARRKTVASIAAHHAKAAAVRLKLIVTAVTRRAAETSDSAVGHGSKR